MDEQELLGEQVAQEAARRGLLLRWRNPPGAAPRRRAGRPVKIETARLASPNL
jgi:hypothetical protein